MSEFSLGAAARQKKKNIRAIHNAVVFFKAMIPLANLHIESMATWTDDKVWLSFNLCTPKSVIFQYTRTVRTLIMEHQIFNKCGNTYHTIQEISTEKKKKRKTFSGTKEP